MNAADIVRQSIKTIATELSEKRNTKSKNLQHCRQLNAW
ncbi:hypothetical protein A464_1364 [Salmonella bongori N268-08]|uniref:Uncharacterized protein n=1 Tax=Salmonella bongori N268-08 TaxID=1197719 RepID=S5N7M3_SALBN|nr:hypothetical protein A464_1364 [Salmonella bongori N268-08]